MESPVGRWHPLAYRARRSLARPAGDRGSPAARGRRRPARLARGKRSAI